MSPIFFYFVLVPPFLVSAIVYFILRAKNQLKPQNKPAIFPILVLLAASIGMSYWASVSIEHTRDFSFNGVIQKAVYEKPKQIPTIMINGVDYNLGGLNYPDYDTIVVGDIAIKEKGSFKFRLIKGQRK